MKYTSINPYTGEEVVSIESHSEKELQTILNRAGKSFDDWKDISLKERSRLMKEAGKVLEKNLDKYARLLCAEMGKPIVEARAEIKKCAWVCAYYAENAADFLADEIIKTEAQKSFVRHDPMGCIFAVMPWNYPFWQVFRFAAPTLTAGNTAILKHAQTVFGCAREIEGVFREAGFPSGVFQSVYIRHDQTESVISHAAVKAISLTGSERAGSSVAEIAGRHLKKSLLELGGSNAFIVLADADIDEAVKTAVNARMMNAGQSCIAAKRFIIEEKVYDEFVDKFVKAVIELKSGNPTNEDTQIGVLARIDLAEGVQKQVAQSIKKGAKLLLGGKHKGAYHEPTVLGDVKPGMAAFDEETFGPVAAMIKAKNLDEAYALSQQTIYALGVMVFTKNIDQALANAARVKDGAYFINEMVKSDPRLPFGGQGNSGFGRELSKDGMMEFINRKTVYVK